MFTAGCKIVISSSSLIHSNNTWLKTVLKHTFCLCLLTENSVFPTDLQMQVHSLPAGGAVGAGEV